IKVRHLAQPSSLTPPKAVYLAWIRPNAQAAQKLGAIQLDSNLSGELKTTTTVRDGEVLITPEQSVNASAPSLPAVLQAHVNAK
ncbi:MAG: hypothetical protein ACRD1F_02225, partial [Terriglobales bacterium]